MVVREDGYLDLYNEYLTRSPGPPIDFRNATAIAMSSDGGSFAVIRNGGVRVNGEKEDLIAPELTPTTVAAAFADGGALVTRTPREVRIWRPDSPKNEKLAPDQLWMKWRKQIGFLDAGQPPPGVGWDPVARDVRRY